MPFITYRFDEKGKTTKTTVFKIQDTGNTAKRRPYCHAKRPLAKLWLAGYPDDEIGREYIRKNIGPGAFGDPGWLGIEGTFGHAGDMAIVHGMKTCTGLIIASKKKGGLDRWVACHYSGAGSNKPANPKDCSKGELGTRLNAWENHGGLYAVCTVGPEAGTTAKGKIQALCDELPLTKAVFLWRGASLGLRSDGYVAVSGTDKDLFVKK